MDFVSITNTDDALTQPRWSVLCSAVNRLLSGEGKVAHVWASLPHSPDQSACWALELDAVAVTFVRAQLLRLAKEYHQAIAWAQAEPELLAPGD